jgi:hypothetical protein
MDPKSEVLLQTYKKEVEKLARGVYLQAISIKKEVETSRINPEDKMSILINIISLLSSESK